MTKSHWRLADYRIESLRITILGLERSIEKIKAKLIEIDWYDGLWCLEESEPIYGLAFIAFQNYINSSIYDRDNSLKEQFERYKLGEKFKNSEKTDIELIVGLANYFKHRDDHKDFHIGTKNILNDFNFQFDKDTDIDNSPIFRGLDKFSNTWSLKQILKNVENWRERLWFEE